MTRFVSLQTNFSSGAMDPLLLARVDLAAYQNALSEATNVVIQPQGGARRRAGLKYLSALPNSGAESAANGVRCVAFEFSTSDSYMLVFTHNRMYVYRNKVLITNINGTGNSYLSTSGVGLTGARLATICWTQSADTLVVVHPAINPIKIVRGATNADWTATAITFDSIPKYAFTLTVTNPAGTLTPSLVHKVEPRLLRLLLLQLLALLPSFHSLTRQPLLQVVGIMRQDMSLYGQAQKATLALLHSMKVDCISVVASLDHLLFGDPR